MLFGDFNENVLPLRSQINLISIFWKSLIYNFIGSIFEDLSVLLIEPFLIIVIVCAIFVFCSTKKHLKSTTLHCSNRGSFSVARSRIFIFNLKAATNRRVRKNVSQRNLEYNFKFVNFCFIYTRWYFNHYNMFLD